MSNQSTGWQQHLEISGDWNQEDRNALISAINRMWDDTRENGGRSIIIGASDLSNEYFDKEKVVIAYSPGEARFNLESSTVLLDGDRIREGITYIDNEPTFQTFDRFLSHELGHAADEKIHEEYRLKAEIAEGSKRLVPLLEEYNVDSPSDWIDAELSDWYSLDEQSINDKANSFREAYGEEAFATFDELRGLFSELVTTLMQMPEDGEKYAMRRVANYLGGHRHQEGKGSYGASRKREENEQTNYSYIPSGYSEADFRVVEVEGEDIKRAVIDVKEEAAMNDFSIIQSPLFKKAVDEMVDDQLLTKKEQQELESIAEGLATKALQTVLDKKESDPISRL